MTRIIWAILGIISLGLGIAGTLLPLLPTVPFLLLAAFFFARSSERLHLWLLKHPKFGSAIQDWQERKAISKRAKIAASVSMIASLTLTFFLAVPTKIIALQAAILAAVALFIWTRPGS